MSVLIGLNKKLQKYKKKCFILAKVCNSIGDDVFDCCSIDNPCDVLQGDCDSDSDCIGNLICGNDNCPSTFKSSADCCAGNFTIGLSFSCERIISIPNRIKTVLQTTRDCLIKNVTGPNFYYR